jgi:hypothetical protein
MQYLELFLSQEVTAGQEVAKTYLPDAGASIIVSRFFGSAVFNINCTCKLIWKYGTGSETLLWSVRGESESPANIVIAGDEIDGVNMLAITLDNGSAGIVSMSSYVRLEVS